MLTLKQFDDILSTISNIVFVCDKIIIESHFHVTEIAYIQKSFVDCGGTKRHEQYVSMQLWVASDIDHCLSSVKLRKIIEIAKDMISDFDIPLVIEYQ